MQAKSWIACCTRSLKSKCGWLHPPEVSASFRLAIQNAPYMDIFRRSLKVTMQITVTLRYSIHALTFTFTIERWNYDTV
jgi:hypothetical protein